MTTKQNWCNIMKKISQTANKTIVAKVFYDSYFREYVVKLYVSGKKLSGSSYYTDDREDAILTSGQMVTNFRS